MSLGDYAPQWLPRRGSAEFQLRFPKIWAQISEDAGINFQEYRGSYQAAGLIGWAPGWLLASNQPADGLLARKQPAGCLLADKQPAGWQLASSQPAGWLLASNQSSGWSLASNQLVGYLRATHLLVGCLQGTSPPSWETSPHIFGNRAQIQACPHPGIHWGTWPPTI